MKRLTYAAVSIVMLTVLTPIAQAMDKNEPWFGQVKFDQLEARDVDNGTLAAWDIEAWYGGDLNKLYLATEGERLLGGHGETEKLETRAAWSHAFAPFWDWRIGARRDWQPDAPRRDWASFGVQGLAPYFFATNATLFVGEQGLINLRLKVEYELLVTQRLILTPKLEANAYGKRDRENGMGAGLTNLEGGLRLRYEIRHEFAPYIGINWTRQYGDTASYTRAAGADPQETSLVAGVRAWF